MRKILIIFLSFLCITCNKPSSDTNRELIPGMVFVNEGTFQMGDHFNEGDRNELPTHKVTVSSFYIGQYEITHKEFIIFLNEQGVSSNGTYNGNTIIEMTNDTCAIGHNGSFYFKSNSKATTVDCPVIEVTWYGAIEYCNWLSKRDGLSSCYSIKSGNVTCDFTKNGYRLPTEAEWEFAARGGVDHSDNYKYPGVTNNLDDYAWYSSNSASTTHAVGTKLGNQLDIHDMSGNVWEWCWDRYGSYSGDSQSNPTGRGSGLDRIVRGGGWNCDSGYNRVAYRGKHEPFGFHVLGFRILRNA